MIQQKTVLIVVDNSGAKKIRCIKVLGGFKRKTAKLGDIIIASVQRLRLKNRYRSKLKRGDVVRALIISTKVKQAKKNGGFFQTGANSVILINKQGNLIGTRILSAISRSQKKKKLLKYLSLCPGTF